MRYMIIICFFTLFGCGLFLPRVNYQAINDKGILKLQANSSRFTALQFIELREPLYGKGDVFGLVAPVFWNNEKDLRLDKTENKVAFNFVSLQHPLHTNSLYKFIVAIGNYDVEIYFIIVDTSKANIKQEVDPLQLSDTMYVLNYSNIK